MGHCRTSQHPARAPEQIHRTGTSVVVPARQCLHLCQQVFAHLRLSEHNVQRVAIVAMRKQSHAKLHGEWRLIHARLDAHPLLHRHTPTHEKTITCEAARRVAFDTCPLGRTPSTAPTHSNPHPLLRPHCFSDHERIACVAGSKITQLAQQPPTDRAT
jgi:hypothetical protein